MNIRQAKEIPLEEVLARLGHAPAERRGKELWYRSPLRSEAKPSFKTNERNQWYDFATGKHGDVLDLIQELCGVDSVKNALAELRRLVGEPLPELRAAPKHLPTRAKSDAEILSVGPIESRSLIRYLESRGLTGPSVTDQLKEVRYRRADKEYFAIGFENSAGGFEIRTAKFKGSVGSKAITEIPGACEAVAVFEGFTDYLTAQSRSLLTEGETVVVMNSTAMSKAVVKRIAELRPKLVNLWLDHDAAGEHTTRSLTEALAKQVPEPTVVDRSGLYAGFKDLNAFHVASLRGQER
ncbi:MAG: toprim domain-containing protein [Planctomycetota bacterium]